MKRCALLPALLLLSAGLAFPLDFGLLLDEKFEYGKFEGENNTTASTTGFTPWFSWDGGEGLSLYFSGLFTLWYGSSDDGISDNDGFGKPALLPELSRFSVSYRINQSMSLEAGRVFYADVLGVTASGLFDGVRYEASFGQNTLNAGLYYTGLLYKETAKIVMTGSDADNYGDTRRLDDFFDDYFASRRLLLAARWDMPLGETNNFSFEALFQFDLNGDDDRLHSQYAEAQIELFAYSKIGLTAGVFFEAMEARYIDENHNGVAFGALGILRIDLPTPINDGLKLSSKYSSGSWDDTFVIFTPLSSQTQGNIFPEPFSGMWVNKLDYEARILRSLFAEASFGYYTRTYSEDGSDGSLYGAEVWASLAWQPFDDARVNLGGGLFLPGLGNAKYNDNKTMWKIAAGFALAL
jgi:hypothetical protein